MATVEVATNPPEIAPIVIDLGKEKKRRIKDLKRGGGKLMEDVRGVVSEVRRNLGADHKDLVPVVIIYRKKAKRKRRLKSLFPLLY